MLRICSTQAKLLLVAATCVLSLGAKRPASPERLDELKEIKIGDETHPICPDEELIRAGFPVRKVPDKENAAIEYVKAINLYVELPDDLYDVYSYVIGNVWVDEARGLIPWLDRNAPAISAVREGARKKDCRFPVLKKPDELLSTALLPQVLPKKDLARLLIVQGKYLEYQGKYQEALESYLAVAKVGYHVSRDPILISGLVGLALEAVSTKAIESCVLRNGLRTVTLSNLLDKLNVARSAAENYSIAMEGEKAFYLIGLDELFDWGEQLLVGEIEEGSWSLSDALVAILGRFPGVRAIMKSDIRRYWNWMDRWNELPDHIALRQENRRGDRIIEEMPAWSVGKLMLSDVVSRARIAFVRAKAARAVLKTEVALQIFKGRSGCYPDGLGRLREILAGLPMDPFTDEPLKYSRTETGYIVFSVGDNLKDDGGDGQLTGGGKDIVGRFPLPAPKPFKQSLD